MNIHTDLFHEAIKAEKKMSEGYAAVKQLRELIEKTIREKFPLVTIRSVQSSVDEPYFILVLVEGMTKDRTSKLEVFVDDMNKDMPDFVLHVSYS